MIFEPINISTQSSGTSRTAGIDVHIQGQPGFVSVRFSDPENPDETNAAEKLRIKAAARDMLLAAAAAL